MWADGTVGLGGRESVGEGYGEGVEGRLPAHGPPGPAGAGGAEGSGHEIQALYGGLLGREMPTGLDRSAVAGVEALDGVRIRIRYEMSWRPIAFR